MPHKQQVNLPTSWTRDKVYKMFEAEQLERAGNRIRAKKDLVSKSHFLALWAQHLPEFVILKVCVWCCTSGFLSWSDFG